jgi:hypothetical protein
MAISKSVINRQQLNNNIKEAMRDVIDGTPFWVDVVLSAATLDGAKSVTVLAPAKRTDQYRVRDIKMQGGGTNFGAGGDRTITLTDATTVWTTIPNASIEAIAAAGSAWGSTPLPQTTTGDTKSVAGASIVFKYAGGTTDHTTGSFKVSVLLEKA